MKFDKSDIMKRAWKRAVCLARIEDDEKSTFQYNRNGTRTLTSAPSEKCRPCTKIGQALRLTWAEVKERLAEDQAAAAPVSVEQPIREKGTYKRRYIELLSRAIREKLEHGSSWSAGWWEIDAKGLPPEWEGEQICYVYVY